MGCFDYKCECGGKSCAHIGGQLNDADVIIEIPVANGAPIYAKGHYDEYGYVTVSLTNGEKVRFYLEEFRQYFEFWFDKDREHRGDNYLASKVWTEHEETWTEDRYGSEVHGEVDRNCFYKYGTTVMTKLTPELLEKCIHP